MPVDFKDYYAVLGVTKDATAEEIKKAFRKLARTHHPDVSSDKKASEEKFKEINEAYEVLGDPVKRKKYDDLGSGWQGGMPFGGGSTDAWGGSSGRREFHFQGTGFSDFFEQFFGGGGYGYGAPASAARQRGNDVEGDILVTLEEAMTGTVKPISLQSTHPVTGRVETRTFQVRIPAGIADGKRIRVAGHGGPGAGGAEPGDLFLRVRHAAHPHFHASGHDLYRDLDLAPWEAVLGAEISVSSLDGDIKLRIPAGTANGQTFRVRGRGLPTGKSNTRGDLHVVAQIQVPASLPEAERAAWEALRNVSNFNPRKS
jgi:curved DNA-binding protein